jgi:hypothetical protein
MGTAGVTWQDLVIAGTPAAEALGFGFPNLPDANLPLEPYAHVLNGRRQPGVFLGYGNVTAWGFNYISDSEMGSFYYMRLLGPNSNNLATGEPLNDGEFKGFIMIPSDMHVLPP